MKLKVKFLIGGIIIAVALIFFYGWHLGRKKGDSATEALKNTLNKEIARLTISLDDKTTYVAKVEQELKTEKQARKDGDISRKELRALNLKQTDEISRLKLRIDTLLEDVAHNGQIVHVDTVLINGKPSNAILLPFEFNKTDQWLTLNGKFNSQGKLDMSLKMNLSLDVYTGIDKTTKKYTTLITTDTPYIGVIGIKSQKYDLPKDKKYNVSLFVGYGLTKKLEGSPVIAVGVGKTLFKF
jgi:hypothetical protein